MLKKKKKNPLWVYQILTLERYKLSMVNILWNTHTHIENDQWMEGSLSDLYLCVWDKGDVQSCS